MKSVNEIKEALNFPKAWWTSTLEELIALISEITGSNNITFTREILNAYDKAITGAWTSAHEQAECFHDPYRNDDGEAYNMAIEQLYQQMENEAIRRLAYAVWSMQGSQKINQALTAITQGHAVTVTGRNRKKQEIQLTLPADIEILRATQALEGFAGRHTRLEIAIS